MAYFKPTSHLEQAANRSYASELKEEQTLHVSLQRSHIQRGSIMLALLLSVLVTGAAFSQSFTPPTYDLLRVPHKNIAGLNASSLGNREHFVWATANGYGQWTASDKGNWYLMSNRLGDFDPSGPPKTTNGAVASGTLGFIDPSPEQDLPRDIKVTSNLLGDVRYVWPDAVGDATAIPAVPARGRFIIKGFSEAGRGGIPPIDISYTGIPKGPFARDIIKSASAGVTDIQLYQSATTVPANQAGYRTVYQTTVANQFETDWRDVFDVACDGYHIYIVWQFQNPITQGFEIYATVLKISDGSQVNGFPIKIADGRRPTIACDVRKNTVVTTQNPAVINFDVAYIDVIPQFGQTANGRVIHSATVNGVTQAIVAQPLQYTINPAPTYANPFHARMIVSSSASSANTVKGIYVIADNGTTIGKAQNIFFHKIINTNTTTPIATPHAYHIDGLLTTTHPLPLASNPSPPMSQYEVWNEPIIAFANPYDGNPAQDAYDEFHCLYGLDATIAPANVGNALHVVRGNNVGTRSILNTRNTSPITVPPTPPTLVIYSDPDVGSECGYVNQMGIHTHWYEDYLTESRLYYNRDRRAFNEPIEENTLITDTCFVRDGALLYGTSGEHGSTILPGKQVTLWSELKYATNLGNTNGTYINVYGNQPLFAGVDEVHAKLFLIGEVHLSVGTGLVADAASTLTMLPNSQVIFSEDNTSQVLDINKLSTLQFYGYPGLSALSAWGFTNFVGKGKILADGGSQSAKINVHGGATLQIPDKVTLEMNGSLLDFLYEQNIVPPYQSTDPLIQDQVTGLNMPKTGSMIVNGTVIMDNSDVISRETLYAASAIIKVTSSYNPAATGLPAQQWSTTGTFFKGSWNVVGIDYGVGNMQILFENGISGTSYRKVLFDECAFQGAAIYGINPTSDFTVSQSSFTRTGLTPLTLKRQSPYPAYTFINILDNTFTLGVSYGSLEYQGIYLERFDEKRSTTFDKVFIDNNIFDVDPYGQLWSFPIDKAAINLQSTSALVTDNIISGYPNGIINQLTERTSGQRSNSFFCTNTISDCPVVGLLTKNWNGHARLNRIFECGVGHESQAGDLGGVTHSRYFNNGIGLYLSASSSQIDISGLHSGSGDLPAFDTIDHNSEVQIKINGSKLILGTVSTTQSTYVNYAQNTIVSTNEDDILISNQSTSSVYLGASSLTDGLNENFWGFGASLSTVTAYTSASDIANVLTNVTYAPTTTPDLALPTSIPGWSSAPQCGESYDFGNHFIQSSQSFELDSSNEHCGYLLDRGRRNKTSEWWDRANDTLRLFIERCANAHGSWTVFGDISGIIDINKKLHPQEKWVELREWFKKVLYYNLDTNYYCADVNELRNTFVYFEGRGYDYLGAAAVLKYLKDNKLCLQYEAVSNFDSIFRVTMEEIIFTYRDTVTDSLKTPLDTTLPSLEDLDLTILRGPQNSVTPATHEPHLGELIATRNPFTDILELKYRLDKSAMVRIDVYDLLGRAVYSEGQGYKAEGEHVLLLQSKGWASGSYYVRLSSPSGEVKTVKVVKE